MVEDREVNKIMQKRNIGMMMEPHRRYSGFLDRGRKRNTGEVTKGFPEETVPELPVRGSVRRQGRKKDKTRGRLLLHSGGHSGFENVE